MNPLFEVRNLSVGYGTPLLKDISFSLTNGQMVGILGRNGCGKTTLFRGISGSIRRFSGQIFVNGEDCSAMSPRQQAAHLSLLPQNTEVMEGILSREVIAMGRYPYGSIFREDRADTQMRTQQSAEMLGIADLLEQDCGFLSQGQRQLVLLARLLTQDTPVMLLDEPNAALDYDNTHTVFATLQQLVKATGKTALLILHDPELALKWCDRVLLLKGGGICGDISPIAAQPKEAEQALQQLYPKISVRRDPFGGTLRCYTNDTEKE